VHSQSTFGAWMSHGHTWNHKTHHNLDLGKPQPSPYNIFYDWPQGLHPNVIFSQDAQGETLEIPKIGIFVVQTFD